MAPVRPFRIHPTAGASVCIAFFFTSGGAQRSRKLKTVKSIQVQKKHGTSKGSARRRPPCPTLAVCNHLPAYCILSGGPRFLTRRRCHRLENCQNKKDLHVAGYANAGRVGCTSKGLTRRSRNGSCLDYRIDKVEDDKGEEEWR